MTSPNGEFPAGAYGINTVASMQNVTQKSVADGQAASILNLLGEVWDSLIDNLLGGFSNVVGAIAAAINQFLSNILNALGIGGGGGGLLGLFTGFLNDTRNTANSGGSAGAAAAAAVAAAQAAASAVAAQGAQVQAVKAAILSFQDGIPLQPFSHSMTNSEMTFDRSRIRRAALSDVTLTGSVSSNSGATWSRHTHTAQGTGSNTGATTLSSHGHDDNFALSKTLGQTSMFTPPANTVVAGFIRAKWGGLRESFTFATGSVTSPCSLSLLVGRMNPDTGDIAILWVSADQTPIVGTGKAEYVIPIPDGVVLADRETIFVGIHQYGSGNVRPVVAITDLDDLPRDGLLYPAKPNTRFGRSTALTAGTSIPASSLLFDTDVLPWLGVGQSLTIPLPAPTNLYEPLDDTSLPANLVRRSSSSAKVVGGIFVVSGTNDGERNYQHVKRLNRNNHFVESQIIDPHSSRQAVLGLRADANGYNRTVMLVNAVGVQIARRGSGSTVLASASVTIASTDVLRFSAIDNVYSIHRIVGDASTLLCQYVDSANALPVGIDNRYITIGVLRDVFFNSGGWSYLLAADMPDPE